MKNLEHVFFPLIMFFIFFPANLAQKFKKSIYFFSLFLYFLSNETHKISQIYKHKDKLTDLQNTKTFNNYSIILSHSHYKHKDLIQNTFNNPKVLTRLNPNLQTQANPNGKNPI